MLAFALNRVSPQTPDFLRVLLEHLDVDTLPQGQDVDVVLPLEVPTMSDAKSESIVSAWPGPSAAAASGRGRKRTRPGRHQLPHKRNDSSPDPATRHAARLTGQ